jgi:MarR family transcriptional regulator, lower aerobic nicotinate degradation pathway regulator
VTDPSAETDRAAAYVLDDQIGFLLRKAQQRHLALFASIMVEGLTAQQFATLARLAEIGPSSQNALGRATAMDNSTINGVVGRLRERGLVVTAPAPDDNRMHLVQLTGAGRDLLAAALPAAHEITARTLEPLLPAEVEVLIGLLRRLG